MLLHQDNQGGGTLLAAHVSDFASTLTAWRWRRSARSKLPEAPGLVFAKALPFIGSSASAGLGAGLPGLRRQVLLTAWRRESDFEHFLGQPSGSGSRGRGEGFVVVVVRGLLGRRLPLRLRAFVRT